MDLVAEAELVYRAERAAEIIAIGTPAKKISMSQMIGFRCQPLTRPNEPTACHRLSRAPKNATTLLNIMFPVRQAGISSHGNYHIWTLPAGKGFTARGYLCP